MKNPKSGLLTLFLISLGSLQAQTLNWGSLQKENKQVISAQTGMDYGVTFGLSYGYQVRTPWFPIVLGAEYSFPSGKHVLDDFKTKLGAQIRFVQYHNFCFSGRVQGVFRRYENEFVRMVNFGSDLAGTIGYYRPRWFVAGEAGFDKAIVTHFKHRQAYRDQFPGVIDGWYQPATGGNFYYGLQTGISFGKHDLTLKAGKVLQEDFKTKPLLPFYGQIGYNIKF